MTTPEILRRAADEVQKGWVRWNRHDHALAHERVCALGGLENAIGQQRHAERDCPEAIYALSALLPLSDKESLFSVSIDKAAARIAGWNNAADQTQANVAATMELAAIIFEQQHVADSLDADSQHSSADAVPVGSQSR